MKKPESFTDDPLTDILRQGARQLLATALETEINLFLNEYKEITDAKGYQRIVRNGYLPEREIQTGIGQVPVRMPALEIGNLIHKAAESNLLQPFCHHI